MNDKKTQVANLPERLPLTSADMTDALIGQLRASAPQIFSEGRVDFAKLQAALGEHIETNPERYGLTWAGKRDAFRNVQVPSVATLRPQLDESVNWDSTENLIIEGDNLEVLKLLQKPYHGKVKMIYIDPPYNTGNEFIYPDNFREGLDEYLRYTQQLSEEGTATSTNKDTSGRYHSNWLNMMYPRLFLARNLLKENGVIFVSIDDHEVHNLRMLMDEVFGEENFVAEMVWEGANKNTADQIGTNHEYVLVYARSRSEVPKTWKLSKEGVEPILREVERLKKRLGDNYEAASEELAAWYRANKSTPSFAHRRFRYINKNGAYKEDDPTAPGGRKFKLINPKTKEEIPLRPNRGWAFDQTEFNRMVDDERISFISPTSIMVRRYLHETDSSTPQSVFYQPARSASERLEKLLDGNFFPYPKDETVIRQLVEMTTNQTDENNIVLDFFAGSGTTAHAVLELNQQDGGNRRFILVQLPEKTDDPRYPTIAHITRERVRRVGNKLNDTKREDHETAKQDLGFRALKLDSSNFKIWQADNAPQSAEKLAEQLSLYADNVQADRDDQDRLYELILKSGRPLSAGVERVAIAQRTAFSVENGDLLICLEQHLDRDTLRALFARKPQMVLCLDTAFDGNDALKTNTVLEAQSHNVIFRTV